MSHVHFSNTDDSGSAESMVAPAATNVICLRWVTGVLQTRSPPSRPAR
jgi:hypothetical protein